MAWIESHQELGRHPKIKMLSKILGKELPEVVGYMNYLWWWAMDYAQDGDLTRYPSESIADAASWEGDPDTFVAALVTVGFVDRDENGMRLHNWDKYTWRVLGYQERKREQTRERVRRYRESKKKL